MTNPPTDPSRDPADSGTDLPPSAIAVLGGGAAVLIGSFLPVVKLDIPSEAAAFSIDSSYSAWSNAWSLFPTLTVPVAVIVALAAAMAAQRLGNVTIPEEVGQVRLDTLGLTVGLFGIVFVLAQILRIVIDGSGDGSDDPPLSIGVGAFLLLIGFGAFLFGAFQDHAPGNPSRPALDQRGLAVAAGGAGLMFVASFLNAVEIVDEGTNAWAEGTRPVFVVPLLFAVASAVVGLRDNRDSSAGPIAGIPTRTLRVHLAGLALFGAVSLTIGEAFISFLGIGADPALGQFLSLLGAAAVLTGNLLPPATASTDSGGSISAPPPSGPPVG